MVPVLRRSIVSGGTWTSLVPGGRRSQWPGTVTPVGSPGKGAIRVGTQIMLSRTTGRGVAEGSGRIHPLLIWFTACDVVVGPSGGIAAPASGIIVAAPRRQPPRAIR